MADESFLQEFLQTHNDYRRKHGAPPMTLSRELNAAAQAWADNILSLKTMQHSSTPDGENIFYKFSSESIKLTGKEAVESWYSEIRDYNWKSPGYASNIGHFSQVVWKGSTELGVGLATDGNTVFVVGQYRPAGNINTKEHFEENVLPLAGGETGGSGNTSSGATEKKKTCTLL